MDCSFQKNQTNTSAPPRPHNNNNNHQTNNKKSPNPLSSVVFLGETIFSVMFIGKKFMAFSFTVNSHSRHFIIVFSTFSVQ